MDLIEHYLVEICGRLRQVFTVIFPEYPFIGVILAGLAVLLFVYYLIRSGFMAAIKVTLMVFFGVAFGLFTLHHLNLLFHVF